MNHAIVAFSDKDIMRSLMNFFTTISHDGIVSMIPYASYLIWIFGIIDLCTSWYLYDGQLKLSVMIQKIIKIGAFYILVVHWSDIAGAIGKSFAFIGYIAGGHTAQEAATIVGTNKPDKSFFNPSYVLAVGDAVTTNISKGYAEAGSLAFGQIIMYGVCWALVTLGFYFMVLQLILTNIEFAIFTCLAIILLPFGCIRFTSFLSQRAISGVFSFGIKLMIVYFLLGIISAMGDSFNAAIALNNKENGADTASLYSFMLKQSLAYITIGYLVWKLPNLVSGMMQGGQPSLGNGITPSSIAATAGAVVGTTAAAVSNSVHAVKAGSEAGSDNTPGGGGGSGGGESGGGANAAGEAQKQTTATQSLMDGIGLGGAYQQGKEAVGAVKDKINSTPLLNRNATMNQISKYQQQFPTKNLAGKAALVGKMMGLASAQATLDTVKFAGNLAGNIAKGTGSAILKQTGPVKSFKNAYQNGTDSIMRSRYQSQEARSTSSGDSYNRMTPGYEPPPPPPAPDMPPPDGML